jgi:lipopolysaccharide export system protein LptA
MLVIKIVRLSLLFMLLFVAQNIVAQITTLDNTTKIEIIHANSIRLITLDDSTSLRTLAGNAQVKQGNTKLSGDSIVVNSRTNIAEVFGNVHINDADTVNTYADYLRYVGAERIAYLKRGVRLTDGKVSLTTNDLVYNVATGIATYQGGGRVVNGSSVLTSTEAIYFSDTKDVLFKRQVHLVDPKYNIVTDSLRYNTNFKVATLISPTVVKTKDGKVIRSKNGTYDLQTGIAQFYDRTLISDSKSSTIADKMFFDDKTGITILEGRAKYVDSVNHMIIIGDYIETNSKTASFLATKKPVVVIVKDKDSTYITADTLFSGLRKNDNSFNTYTTKKDTLKNKMVLKDSATAIFSKDSSSINKDSIKNYYINVDTINNKQILSKTPQDSIRYILGYAHVRIYNDSSQAVCDSMYYSTEDSVFRMFRNPIVWKEKNQITGDTMYLFTEKQQPKRVYVFNNSLVINQQNPAMYNQAGGRTLNAYFKNGKIDFARLKGSPSETVFYPQAEDSSYTGMNRTSGDVAEVYFLKEEIHKIKFINNVDGTMYPLNQIPADKKYLKNFKWEDKRRPKNKLELFE